MGEERYRQVTDDGGTVSYELVEDTTELTPEQVRDTDTYKKTLDESVKRRQLIQTLKSQLAEGGEETPPEVIPTPDAAQPLDTEKLFEQFLSKVDARDAERREEKTTKDVGIDKLMVEYKLPKDARASLENSEEPEITAQYLQKLNLRFDDISGGALSPEEQLSELKNNTLKRLNLSN